MPLSNNVEMFNQNDVIESMNKIYLFETANKEINEKRQSVKGKN